MSASGETVCWSCKETLFSSGRILTVKDHRYHLLCWRCEECSKLFYDNTVVNDYYHKNNLAVCGDCADQGTTCSGCNLSVSYREPQGQVITALGKRWHRRCFVCTSCEKPITKLKFSKARPDLPFCDQCSTTITPEISKRLEEKQRKLTSLSSAKIENTPVSDSRATLEEKVVIQAKTESKVASRTDSSSPSASPSLSPLPSPSSSPSPSPSLSPSPSPPVVSKPSCYGCNEIIEGDVLNLADHEWHSDCFKCNECFLTLDPTNFFNLGHRIVCSSCMVGTLL